MLIERLISVRKKSQGNYSILQKNSSAASNISFFNMDTNKTTGLNGDFPPPFKHPLSGYGFELQFKMEVAKLLAVNVRCHGL